MQKTAEHQRLQDHLDRKANWKKWGPYVSERAWGTVREDYSADGSAWDYFPHDHARSRAYAGERTVLPASPTVTNISAWPCRCGTTTIPF